MSASKFTHLTKNGVEKKRSELQYELELKKSQVRDVRRFDIKAFLSLSVLFLGLFATSFYLDSIAGAVLSLFIATYFLLNLAWEADLSNGEFKFLVSILLITTITAVATLFGLSYEMLNSSFDALANPVFLIALASVAIVSLALSLSAISSLLFSVSHGRHRLNKAIESIESSLNDLEFLSPKEYPHACISYAEYVSGEKAFEEAVELNNTIKGMQRKPTYGEYKRLSSIAAVIEEKHKGQEKLDEKQQAKDEQSELVRTAEEKFHQALAS